MGLGSSSSVDAMLTCPRSLLCCCSCFRPSGTAPVQVCGLGLHRPSPLNTPSVGLYMPVQCHALGGARAYLPATWLLAWSWSGQQTQAVSDREGLSARVQLMGVCRHKSGAGALLSFGLSFPPPTRCCCVLSTPVSCMQLSALFSTNQLF